MTIVIKDILKIAFGLILFISRKVETEHNNVVILLF